MFHVLQVYVLKKNVQNTILYTLWMTKKKGASLHFAIKLLFE